MNSIKCKSCGLSNFSSEKACRRCGNGFHDLPISKATPASSARSYLPIVLVLGVLAAGYYFYTGSDKAVTQAEAPVGKQPAIKTPEPSQGLTRMEHDRQRAANVGDAIKQNPGLEAQKKQQEETQRIMQQVANSR